MQSEWDNADAYLMNGAAGKNKEKLTLANVGWKSVDVRHNYSRTKVAEESNRPTLKYVFFATNTTLTLV